MTQPIDDWKSALLNKYRYTREILINDVLDDNDNLMKEYKNFINEAQDFLDNYINQKDNDEWKWQYAKHILVHHHQIQPITYHSTTKCKNGITSNWSSHSN